MKIQDLVQILSTHQKNVGTNISVFRGRKNSDPGDVADEIVQCKIIPIAVSLTGKKRSVAWVEKNQHLAGVSNAKILKQAEKIAGYAPSAFKDKIKKEISESARRERQRAKEALKRFGGFSHVTSEIHLLSNK